MTSAELREAGQREIIGRLWWFPDYMIRCPLEELRDKGETEFTLVEEE